MNIDRLKRIARDNGFPITSHYTVERKVPGQPRSMRWANLTLDCPCGRPKTLWVSEDGVANFRRELADHIAADRAAGRI
jgi:hypothetical protein